MQFANELKTIYFSSPEEMLPLAIKICQLVLPQWFCSYLTEAGDNKCTAFWLVNTFTRQYSDWSR